MIQLDDVYLLIGSSEKDKHHFLGILCQMYNLILNTRKHQANLNWGIVCKRNGLYSSNTEF